MQGGRDPPDAAEKRRPVAGCPSAAVTVVLLVALTQLLVFFFLSGHDSMVWRQGPSGGNALSSSPNAAAPDRLLGGLLSSDWNSDDEMAACLSRHEVSKLWKPSPFPVSPYLMQRLRRYEANHRRCGPGTARYREAVARLHQTSGPNAAADDHRCKYVVWIPIQGLGNRMLSLVSTFLYALLAGRVLLLHEPPEMERLFCEPFSGTSWLIPPADFPNDLAADAFSAASKVSYVNMLDNNVVRYNNDDDDDARAPPLPAFVYLHLETVYLPTETIKIRLQNHTFCDDDHRVLDRFPWMVVRSDNYFAPALFTMPMYRAELDRLFPAKGSVFHHLGRYLLRPGNRVWGMVERFFDGYLAGADERVGVQVRNKPERPIPPEIMYEQILRCAREHHLLPPVLATSEPPATKKTKARRKKKKAVAVLVVSLKPEYYERLHGTYYTNATAAATGNDGDVVVTVHQPSHDGEQRSGAREHNERALAEIYLLSFCDRMVTTGWSTFGYAAHALAGTRPWMLMPLDRSKMRADVACVRPASVEPCMHAPSSPACRGTGQDLDTVAPYVPAFLRRCEDVRFGLKLVD